MDSYLPKLLILRMRQSAGWTRCSTWRGKDFTSIKQMLWHQSWEDGPMFQYNNWMNKES
jgi:hypothetical protein